MTSANEEAVAYLNNTKTKGSLKIFLGSAPGVGKTYSMLSEAHELRKTNHDVVIGWVDTHNRIETQELLKGLEIIPRLKVKYQDHIYEQLDVKAIIKRHPVTVVIDEMPHSNPPESVHKKRWQDIEEILDLGINVYTALNIQHLESLNDIVSRVTGVVVNETIPDRVFDKADEVRLVDLPPDDLINRLNAGKIYLPQIVQRAKDNYFKKANLVALRELALRYMANRVDRQVKSNRITTDKENEFIDTKYGLLFLLEGNISQDAIRECSRLARVLGTPWHCVYIDNETLLDDKKHMLELISFAKDLGAITDVLVGNFPYCIKDYCKDNSLNIIALAPNNPKIFDKQKRLIGLLMDDISIISLPYKVKKPSIKQKIVDFIKVQFNSINSIVITTFLTILLTTALFPLSNYLQQTNIAMFYLLLTLFISVRYGIYVAVYSSILSILCFDLAMVHPKGSFVVTDLQYIITFVSILVVSLVSAKFVSHSRKLTAQSRLRENQARILYDMAKRFSVAIDDLEVFNIVSKNLKTHLQIESEFWKVSDEHELVRMQTNIKGVDKAVLNFVLQHKKKAGFGTDTLNQSKYFYIPIIVQQKVYCILVLSPNQNNPVADITVAKVIHATLSLVSQTLERLDLVEDSKQAIVSLEAQRLRNSLIESLSHDLKTPMTALISNTQILQNYIKNHDFIKAQEQCADIFDSASKTVHLMTSLLEMAKLQSQNVVLKKEWIPVEELIGAAINNVKDRIKDYNVKMDIERDCPLFYVDPVLIDRLLTNLLDNAIKYCAKGSTIEIVVKSQGDNVTLAVNDNGEGFGNVNPQRLFDPFKRGVKESKIYGVGLGLAICKTIARVHDADLIAMPSKLGGASFVLVLPIVPMPYTEQTFL